MRIVLLARTNILSAVVPVPDGSVIGAAGFVLENYSSP